jgi:hypothetical protein
MTSGLIKPSERFSQTVQPALDDYLNEPFSQRRANVLASAIDHHVDWTFAYYAKVDPPRLNGAKNERAFRVTLLSECEELRMMNDLSDAAHHRFLTWPNNPPRIIDTSTAAYSIEAGKLHVRKYEKPFLPAAVKAVDFLRNWKD